MEWILLLPICGPIFAACLCQITPRGTGRLREVIALVTTVGVSVIAVALYLLPELRLRLPWFALETGFEAAIDLNLTAFGKLTLLTASGFSLLTVLFSVRYMEGHTRHRMYYACLLAALGMTCGVALSNHTVLLLLCWELLGVFLFLLILVGPESAVPSATKTLLIIGGADLAMLLGFCQLWLSTGTMTLTELAAQPAPLSAGPVLLSFVLILIGVFAKGGVVPFQSWIPAISTEAPIPVMAYMPAAIDKLASIYLLGQMALLWFRLSPQVQTALMVLATITILSGVAMALIQSDLRKMLAFHNVSQVGYMVLGIGTGTAVGVAGGILHMLNLVILKGCLFLCGGAVERQTRQTGFAQLGGLANAMPWTFAASFIAALGISGVPPLNAFVSKWLVYQGVIEHGGQAYIFVLVAAMFGSALTLASFMKLMHSIFWGTRPAGLRGVREASPLMVLPYTVLATLVLVLGFAYPWFLRVLIQPILSEGGLSILLPGIWQSGLATLLLVLSLVVGATFYFVSRAGRFQSTEVFIGGEDPGDEAYRVAGTHFYSPIKTMGGLGTLLHLGAHESFDLFNYVNRAVQWSSRMIYEYIDQGLADLYQEVIPGLLSVVGKLMQFFNARLIPTYILWGLYAIGFFGSLMYPEQTILLRFTQIVACIGMVGWGMLAWVETDLGRLLILGATSQLGFAVLGATLSAEAAFSYLLTGGAAIAAILICGRSITRKLKTTNIHHMDGIAAQMPVRFLIFLLAAFWLSGFPPFGSFYSKYLLGVAAEAYSPLLSVLIASTAFLTVGYFLRPIRRFLRTAE